MAQNGNCKRGLHRYSSAAEIGGGILRRACLACGVVQLDTRNADAVNGTDLFTEPKLATMFKVEALLARVGSGAAPAGRSFGEVPAGRRRPARAFG